MSKIYAAHPDLTLAGRDLPTFNFLKKHFRANKAILVPDIAYMIGYIPFHRHSPSLKILNIERNDDEKVKPTSKHAQNIYEKLSKIPSLAGNSGYSMTDWG